MSKASNAGGFVVTEEHRKAIGPWSDAWFEKSIKTGTADWETFDKHAPRCYELSGLARPTAIVHCASPLAAVMAGPLAARLIEKGMVARHGVFDALEFDRTGAEDMNPATSASNLVRNSTIAAVMALIPSATPDGIRRLAREEPGVIGNNWSDYIGGQFWLGGQAFTSFVIEKLGVPVPDDVRECEFAYRMAQQSATWWWPGDGFIMVGDRPKFVSVDERKALHCDTGKAAYWNDGWGFWVIHGTVVDEQIVMHPETQKVSQINSEPSGDVRAIRVERYGWARYLKDSGAELLDTRDNHIEGSIEALYSSTFGPRLVVTCPTGRVFSLGVPEGTGTCKQAQDWLAGGKNFNVLART